MEYRKLPHGEEKISVIGMGSSVVGEHAVKRRLSKPLPMLWSMASTILIWPAAMLPFFRPTAKALQGCRNDVHAPGAFWSQLCKRRIRLEYGCWTTIKALCGIGSYKI